MHLDHVEAIALADGLTVRGAFHPRPDDLVPAFAGGQEPATLVLLGFVGRDGWPAFARSEEARDGMPDPLDRWSERTLSALADQLGATALFPFGGPPWHPFGRWAVRTGEVFPSPLGILVHPHWGLWHSYRGALAFADLLELPAREPALRASPCATCAAKPCLHACPVSAFSEKGYAVDDCRAHLAGATGRDCNANGCLARRACPVGAEHRYGQQQTRFLMGAFSKG